IDEPYTPAESVWHSGKGKRTRTWQTCMEGGWEKEWVGEPGDITITESVHTVAEVKMLDEFQTSG
ncbi:hypothetical protein BgiMline_024278, partial [Biomphalaria glabrata]